jgi:hypothetical protein
MIFSKSKGREFAGAMEEKYGLVPRSIIRHY